MSIESEVKSVLREVIEFDFEFSNKLDLVDDLGLDSVEFIDLVLKLEDKFHIVFEDEELDLSIITKVELLLDLIRSKMS